MAVIDPYKVLGVSSSATDDEVTQAYRKMAKKYHPDVNHGDKNAETKMQEINAAYDMIKKWRANGDPTGSRQQQQAYGNPYGQQGGYGGGGYQDPFGWGNWEDIFGRSYQQQSVHPRMQAVHNFIVNRQYQQALNLLSEIEPRNGSWFYYSALANAGMGNRVTALNHAREAVRLEPNNTEFQSLLAQLQQGGTNYQQSGRGYGFGMEGAGKTMMQLCIAQAACWFCCRCC